MPIQPNAATTVVIERALACAPLQRAAARARATGRAC
jgi:hypothetical protein